MTEYYLETPEERKERSHLEDKINFPERHNPTKEIIGVNEDICYRCVQNWMHNYFFDAREYCYRRVKA